MEMNRQSTGAWGEAQAEAYLVREKAMRLLDRNWRHGHGELDLVMRQGSVLVVVEVRVRTGAVHGLASYQGIGRHKWRVLRRTAMTYIRRCPWRPESARFDVVGVRRNVDGSLLDITHWENVGVFGRNFRF